MPSQRRGHSCRTADQHDPAAAPRHTVRATSAEESPDSLTALANTIPRDRRRVYDVRALVSSLVDPGSVFETRGALCQKPDDLPGQDQRSAVGVLASNVMFHAGAMTAQSSEKLIASSTCATRSISRSSHCRSARDRHRIGCGTAWDHQVRPPGRSRPCTRPARR